MVGTEWADKEKALCVYYASRGVYHYVIVELLRVNGFKRTLPAVDNQAPFLRRKHQLGSSNSWNIEGVNHWLRQNFGGLVDSLLTDVEFNIVSKLQPQVVDALLPVPPLHPTVKELPDLDDMLQYI